MVTLLNPPTPRSPPESPSDALVSEHEKRVEAEVKQLLVDIRRIGPTYPQGSPHVLFGELFDDDNVQQYYEALVGTLKCAKKRNLITFKGQMLLKGMHDNVKISIVENERAEEEQKTQKVEMSAPEKTHERESTEQESTPAKKAAQSESTKKNSESKPAMTAVGEYEASLIRQRSKKFTLDSLPETPTSSPALAKRKSGSVGSVNNDVKSSPLRTRPPFTIRQTLGTYNDVTVSPYRKSPQRSSPIVSKRKNEIAGTSSDGEAEVNTRQYQPPPPIGSCSDSEADVRTTRRGRITLPPVFLAQKTASAVADTSGRPPAPWRMQKAKSLMNVTKSPDRSVRRASISVLPSKSPARKEAPVLETDKKTNLAPTLSVEATTDNKLTDDANDSESGSPTSTKENDGSSANMDCNEKTPSVAKAAAVRPEPVKQKSFLLSREVSMRVDNEVHRLMEDIHRIGSNPGEPSVTFGELFDDETVQDTYEALVGTLRSAKRQGYIDFKGQMLFKGIHDDVTIHVVDQQRRSESVA